MESVRSFTMCTTTINVVMCCCIAAVGSDAVTMLWLLLCVMTHQAVVVHQAWTMQHFIALQGNLFCLDASTVETYKLLAVHASTVRGKGKHKQA